MNLTESILKVARIDSNTLQMELKKHNHKKNIFLYEYLSDKLEKMIIEVSQKNN